VITPTWERHKPLMQTCVPAVQNQRNITFEHIVVSDGPDPELRALMAECEPDVRFFELPEHDPEKHWGAPARLFGISQARGEFIAYLDDDDNWLSNHLSLLRHALLSRPECGFARSCGIIPVKGGIPWRIGDGAIAHGRVQSSMIMHRASLEANWVSHGAEDWNLVKGWVADGVLCATTNEATCIYNPSGGSDTMTSYCTVIDWLPADVAVVGGGRRDGHGVGELGRGRDHAALRAADRLVQDQERGLVERPRRHLALVHREEDVAVHAELE
jgi:glycosyltransferase involved in cell wall biosynthesis